MASGRIALYDERGKLIVATSYHSPSIRRDILELWSIRYLRQLAGSYIHISPTVNPDRVREDGKNARSTRIFREPREIKKPGIIRPPAIYDNKQYL